MTPPNSDIPITDSYNLDDDTRTSDTSVPQETDAASIRTLQEQGIFLEKEDNAPLRVKPREELSKQLSDMGGIEIIAGNDRDLN